jgi:hypothetical protein
MAVENLKIEDIKWLLNDYNKIRQYGKVNSWMDYHVRALQLLKGSWDKPGCACEYVAHAKIANSTYSQYEQQLKDQLVILETPVINEPGPDSTSPKRSRGRSKKNTEG